MRTGRPKIPLFERFVSKLQLDWDTDCWNWIGGATWNGYGAACLESGKTAIAHRIAYELFIGKPPAGLDVHHKCENQLCCNPKHLEALTRKGHRVAHAALKTECPNGHPYTDSGTYVSKDGTRRCRICMRENSRRQHVRRRLINPPKPHANSVKTECKRGHPFSTENTIITTSGSRQCRECMKMLQLRWKQKHPTIPRGTPKQFCKHGHEMTGANTYTYKNRKSCRICIANRIHKSRDRRKTFLDSAGSDNHNPTQPDEHQTNPD